MEAVDTTLINALINSGLAASASEARRMAQEMVGTSEKVAKNFEEKKESNRMFGFSRQPKENPLPSPESEPVAAPVQATTADFAATSGTQSHVELAVKNVQAQSAPAADPDAYAAAQFGNVTVDQITQDPQPIQESNESFQDPLAAYEQPITTPEPVTQEAPVQEANHIDPQIPQEDQVHSQLLRNPIDAPDSSFSSPQNVASEFGQTVDDSGISNTIANEPIPSPEPVAQEPMPTVGNEFIQSSQPVHTESSREPATMSTNMMPQANPMPAQEPVAQAPQMQSAMQQDVPSFITPTPQQEESQQMNMGQSVQEEKGPQNIVEHAMDNAATTTQEAVPSKEPAKARWTAEEEKLREQTDITKLFNFSGSKN